MEFELNELLHFLYKAGQETYASEDGSLRQKQPDGSTTIAYTEGDWSYRDNYFGGEPYGGHEVVFYKGKAVWMMVYYGKIVGDNKAEDIYPVLAEALRGAPKEAPYRGPEEIKTGHYVYKNSLDGNIEDLIGEEFILKNDEIVFQTSYCGGLVDQK